MSSNTPFSSPYMSYPYQINTPNMSQAYSIPNSVINPHPPSPPQQQPSHHSASHRVAPHQSASQQVSTQHDTTPETPTPNELTPITPGTLPLTGIIPRALMIPPPEASFPTLEELRSHLIQWHFKQPHTEHHPSPNPLALPTQASSQKPSSSPAKPATPASSARPATSPSTIPPPAKTMTPAARALPIQLATPAR